MSFVHDPCALSSRSPPDHAAERIAPENDAYKVLVLWVHEV